MQLCLKRLWKCVCLEENQLDIQLMVQSWTAFIIEKAWDPQNLARKCTKYARVQATAVIEFINILFSPSDRPGSSSLWSTLNTVNKFFTQTKYTISFYFYVTLVGFF